MSYGFEIKNDAGDVVLDNTDTTARVIHIEYVPYSTTSTRQFTVSNFDSNNGFYYVRPHVTPSVLAGDYSAADPHDSVTDLNKRFDLDDKFYIEFSGGHVEASLSWNNSSKVMTVGPNDAMTYYTLTTQMIDLGNMEIIFMEYS
jgi:hypothetical protein